jgi:hypothetical protein
MSEKDSRPLFRSGFWKHRLTSRSTDREQAGALIECEVSVGRAGLFPAG